MILQNPSKYAHSAVIHGDERESKIDNSNINISFDTVFKRSIYIKQDRGGINLPYGVYPLPALTQVVPRRYD